MVYIFDQFCLGSISYFVLISISISICLFGPFIFTKCKIIEKTQDGACLSHSTLSSCPFTDTISDINLSILNKQSVTLQWDSWYRHQPILHASNCFNKSKTCLVRSTDFLVLAWCRDHHELRTMLRFTVGLPEQSEIIV